MSLATLRGAPHVYIPGYPVVGRQGDESGLSVSARGTFGVGLRPPPNLPPACRLTAPTADNSIPLFSAPCTTAHCPPPTPFLTLTTRKWADAVITLDADLQDDIESIPQMVREFEAGNDIVYGVKVSRQADPLMKRLSAQAFYRLQASMGVESVYNHADFRLMSRRALDMLAGYDERNLYLRGLIPMIGLQSATVDDVISERQAGASKYTLSKMFNLALDGITSFSVKPLYSIIYIGITFLIISFCISIYVLHALIAGTAVPGWSSLILSVWLVGGFILIAVGITGVYIGKIYNEVKHRPLYNIQEIL